MALYERGYRDYAGGFDGPSPIRVIFGEHMRTALRRKGVRRLAGIVAIILVIFIVQLYVQMGVVRRIEGEIPLELNVRLQDTLLLFYGFAAIPTALLALMVGSGLVANDLWTRALPLYLVRPLKPVDYALGKALVVPGLMAWFALLPGLCLWAIMGLWQPPGETWAWYVGNLDVARDIGIASTQLALWLAGVALVTSTIAARGGGALAIGAAVYFGGAFLAEVGENVPGTPGHLLRCLDVNSGALRVFQSERTRDWDPTAGVDPGVFWAFCVGIWLLGVFLAWRRARSTEVAA